MTHQFRGAGCPLSADSHTKLSIFIYPVKRYHGKVSIPTPQSKKEAGSFELASLFIVQFILQD